MTKSKKTNIAYIFAIILIALLFASFFSNIFKKGNSTVGTGNNNIVDNAPPSSEENVTPNPDDNFNTLPEDMKPGYIKAGVWEFNDDLTTFDSNLKSYPQSLNFFMPYREDTMYFDVFYLYDRGDGLLKVSGHEYTGEYAATSYTFYDESQSDGNFWLSENYPECKRIIFKSDQKVDDVIYNWFIQNARYVRDNTYDILWHNDNDDVIITPNISNPTNMTYSKSASLVFDWVSTSNYTVKADVLGCEYEVTTVGNGGTSGTVYITLSNPNGALQYKNPSWNIDIFLEFEEISSDENSGNSSGEDTEQGTESSQKYTITVNSSSDSRATLTPHPENYTTIESGDEIILLFDWVSTMSGVFEVRATNCKCTSSYTGEKSGELMIVISNPTDNVTVSVWFGKT